MVDSELIRGNDDITLYFKAYILYGYSSCKGREWKIEVVEINYFDIDGPLKIEGALPPTVCKTSFDPIEPNRFFEYLKENDELNIQPRSDEN